MAVRFIHQRSSDFWWDHRNGNGSVEKQLDFEGDAEKFACVVRPERGISCSQCFCLDNWNYGIYSDSDWEELR